MRGEEEEGLKWMTLGTIPIDQESLSPLFVLSWQVKGEGESRGVERGNRR